jgi:hypothetical protein
MKCILFIFLFLSFSALSQSSELFNVTWTMYPNYALPDSLNSGDTLTFFKDDTTDYNPKITLSIEPSGTVISDLVLFAYQTSKGIIVTREGLNPDPEYTITTDTIVQGDSTTIIESKTQIGIRYLVNHGPAIGSMCELDLTNIEHDFTCGILVGTGSNGTLEGPFNYQIEGDRLILIKK